jgi:hypothetical protein
MAQGQLAVGSGAETLTPHIRLCRSCTPGSLVGFQRVRGRRASHRGRGPRHLVGGAPGLRC